MNLDILNSPYSNDRIMQMIKNKGMHRIGGLVNADIVLATFNLFIMIFYFWCNITLIVTIAIVDGATFIYDNILIIAYEIFSRILFKVKNYKKIS